MEEVKKDLEELKEILNRINQELDYNSNDYIEKFNQVFNSDINLNQLEQDTEKALIKIKALERIEKIVNEFKKIEQSFYNINELMIDNNSIDVEGELDYYFNKAYNKNLPAFNDLFAMISNTKSNLKNTIKKEKGAE